MIIDGGEEAKDLYQDKFNTAIILSDDWYSVTLKQVIVGKAGAITVLPPTQQSQAPTSAIVDSGTPVGFVVTFTMSMAAAANSVGGNNSHARVAAVQFALSIEQNEKSADSLAVTATLRRNFYAASESINNGLRLLETMARK